MLEIIKILLTNEDGQGLVEYAFILVLVGLAVFTVLGLFGDSLPELFSKAIAGLKGSTD